jgi:eukaryotic-like serine/threonine-protein kinase
LTVFDAAKDRAYCFVGMGEDATDPSTERARGRVGTTVDGKWHLDALLGVGGMASVYAATHRNGTRAAIKILNPDIALNPDAKSRFLREGYVANKIGHPRVVLVQDDDEAPDGTVYLVMELLEGETLQNVIAEGKNLPVKEVLRIARDVLDVLEVAHAKDVIHRDLKPGNLLLARDGSVKLLDFGVAKVRESTVVGVPNVTTLSAMGTPGFMPPEQARGRWDVVDGRADIWAIGATMFALLTRRYVHEEETPNEQLLAAMTKPARKLKEAMPDAPAFVAEIVDRALAFDREERYRDAAEMKEAIAVALEKLDDTPASDPISKPVTRKAPPKTPVTAGATVSDVATRSTGSMRWLAFAGAAIVVIGLVVFFKNSTSTTSGETPVGSGSSPVIAAETTKPPMPPTSASVVVAIEPAPSTPPSANPSASSTPAVIPVVKPRPNAVPSVRPSEMRPSEMRPSETVGTPPPPPPPAPSASVDIFGKRH